MGKTKDRPKYQSVSLAVPFVDNIKKYIFNKPEYRSVADFAREAIREKMQKPTNTHPKDIENILFETKSAIIGIEKKLGEMEQKLKI